MHVAHSSASREGFPYRLCAIDIDDTLVGSDKVVSGANWRAVGRLRSLGVRVVLASGRQHDNVLPFHRLLGLDDYVVSSNGALVKHAETEEVLYERAMPESLARTLMADGASRGATVLCYGHNGVYASRADRWTDVYAAEANAVPVAIVDPTTPLPEPTLLKVLWAADPERIEGLVAEASDRYAGRLTTCVTSPYYLEFAVPEADKGAGVAAVAARYGVPTGRVLAFGDGNNDVSLLAWAGMGVAMADGRPAAKAAAARVSPPGDPGTALARAVAALLGDDVTSAVA